MAAIAPSTLTGSGRPKCAVCALQRAFGRPESAGRARLRAPAPAPSETAGPRAGRGYGTGARTRRHLDRLRRSRSTIASAACCSDLADAHHRQPAIEKPHARFDVAAMMRTEGEDAGRDAVLERRASRRDVARRHRRRRRHPVVDGRHQHRVQHPADRRRRQLAHQQQIDASPKPRRPIISSSGYPRTRILLGAMAVSDHCQRSDACERVGDVGPVSRP